ncbi:MAG: SDR family oxidoreductase [Chloroflexota bacterium]
MTHSNEMSGKICLVTGATSGIGEVTAQGLAAMGATVIVVGRTPSKGEATVNMIKQATGNQDVTFMQADLSSQASIHKLAEDFKAKYQHLHVLVNNAGAMNMERSVTVDGLETTFAVNHLAYFLLTMLLLDVLKASAPARVVNVSSEAQSGGKIDFDDLQGEKHYSGFGAYSQSKLANVIFSQELANRLQGTEVTSNSLHPGLVATGFGKNNNLLMRGLLTLGSVFFISAKKGAETSIYLASSPEVEGVTGKYFIKKAPARINPAAEDDAIGQRLWQVSEELTHLVPEQH